jgi:hypothetical protein
MKMPPEASEWLREKVEGHRWCGVLEARTVTHEWYRIHGGRSTRAGLTVSIAPAEKFSLCFPNDPNAAEYIVAVRNGLFSVLLSQSWSPILKCAINFEAFAVHEIESSYAGFFMVSREATERLLGLVPGYAHNVAW